VSLSKSKFVSGLQCPKKLWWEVHEADAPELVPDPGTHVVFDRGHQVGALARTYVPGGVSTRRCEPISPSRSPRPCGARTQRMESTARLA
jgi:hypothetical protein